MLRKLLKKIQAELEQDDNKKKNIIVAFSHLLKTDMFFSPGEMHINVIGYHIGIIVVAWGFLKEDSIQVTHGEVGTKNSNQKETETNHVTISSHSQR